MSHKSGRHFLQIPGPTNVPDRILRAMNRPTIDHRGPAFADLGKSVLDGIKGIFKTESPVIIFPSSGSGALEAALVNTLSPGDKILMYETGQFAVLWHSVAVGLGLDVDMIPGDWRSGVDATKVRERLQADSEGTIKAVCLIHNDTSTGIASQISEIRAQIEQASHAALLMVDTVSSLGAIDYEHDKWGVDVSVSSSQKGLMLPAGLSFTAISDKAIKASQTAGFPCSYWRWDTMLEMNRDGFFPYTPATNLLFGLQEAIAMMTEEGLDNIFARHARHGEATRRAVSGWGLEVQAEKPEEFSNALTVVRMPDGHDADEMQKIALEKFDLSLGAGLGKVSGKVFRIGHLGDFNDLMLAGTLSGVEMSLQLCGIDSARGGIEAALSYLKR